MSAGAGFQAWLGREGVIAEAVLRAAVQRQQIYGGTLDTALLERGTLTETALWERLAAATGLPPPRPELCDPGRPVIFSPPLASPPRTSPPLSAEVTRPLRTVPVGSQGNTVDFLCAEPVAGEAIRQIAADQGLVARLYVVPETRMLAMRQRVYGEPLPARYAALLARSLGAARARRALASAGSGGASRASVGATPPPPPPPPGLQELRESGGSSPGPSPVSSSFGGDAATPLEHFLDLSGALPMNSSGAEVEVEVEEDTVAPPPTAGALAISQQMTAPEARPVNLEVISSAPADHEGRGGRADDGGSDSATEALCRRARDRDDKGRGLALRALRQRLAHPATQALLQELRAAAASAPGAPEQEAVSTIEALVELRDGAIIPRLIEWLSPSGVPPAIGAAAHQGLVALCGQDFGRARRRWETWAARHAAQPRVEWLLEALTHKQAAIRAAAAEELRHLAGDSFGYQPDAPRRERDRGRRRYVGWWQEISRTQAPIPGGNVFLAPPDQAPLPPAPKAR